MAAIRVYSDSQANYGVLTCNTQCIWISQQTKLFIGWWVQWNGSGPWLCGVYVLRCALPTPNQRNTDMQILSNERFLLMFTMFHHVHLLYMLMHLLQMHFCSSKLDRNMYHICKHIKHTHTHLGQHIQICASPLSLMNIETCHKELLVGRSKPPNGSSGCHHRTYLHHGGWPRSRCTILWVRRQYCNSMPPWLGAASTFHENRMHLKSYNWEAHSYTNV